MHLQQHITSISPSFGDFLTPVALFCVGGVHSIRNAGFMLVCKALQSAYLHIWAYPTTYLQHSVAIFHAFFFFFLLYLLRFDDDGLYSGSILEANVGTLAIQTP
ncbi:hypothetical protein GGR58DRAFT_466191 [Xylaria digitata]|nr:hypothetical protein GGR58DRAFT_466191 [Xylaria digitata]